MDPRFQPVDQPNLIALLRAKSAQKVVACAQKDGWSLVLRSGDVEWILADAGKPPRIFPSLNVLGGYLRGIAVANFLVDVSAIDPRTGDADLQARLREARQAAEHGERIRRQMLEALDAAPARPAPRPHRK